MVDPGFEETLLVDARRTPEPHGELSRGAGRPLEPVGRREDDVEGSCDHGTVHPARPALVGLGEATRSSRPPRGRLERQWQRQRVVATDHHVVGHRVVHRGRIRSRRCGGHQVPGVRRGRHVLREPVGRCLQLVDDRLDLVGRHVAGDGQVDESPHDVGEGGHVKLAASEGRVRAGSSLWVRHAGIVGGGRPSRAGRRASAGADTDAGYRVGEVQPSDGPPR